MIFPFFLLLGCADQSIETWADLMTSPRCAKAKDKNACRAKECQEFYSSKPQSSESDASSINSFCNLMDTGDNLMAQVCGLPACLLLPTVDPEMALEQLERDLPKRTHQKKARKAIIRGFLQNPTQFEAMLERGKNQDYWLGVAIAEIDCGENSTAKLFDMPCGGPYIASAQKVWTMSQTKSIQQSPLLMSLATMLAPGPIVPKLIATVLDPNQEVTKRIAAGNSLQIAVEKGYTISPSGLQMMEDNCKSTNDPALYSMCLALEKTK